MQNLHATPIRIDSIVDIQRGMKQPSDVRVPLDRSADIWKDLKGINMVEKRVGELLSRVRMSLARPIEYLLQIG